MTIPEVMDLGVRHFEHFFTLATSVMDLDEHKPAIAELYGVGPTRNLDEYTALLSLYFDYIAYEPELDAKLRGLIKRMAEEGATISTTLRTMEAVSSAPVEPPVAAPGWGPSQK